ncbi:MAG: dehydrogenase [Rhodospirillaceae bacterium]|jgi:3-hydroxyisobutyrate dehydrogenase|nr:dehydrogenase [Rhodospirillaceae bacterium]|tara:strand:+ start:10183 stop:11055 length:873 start_codon:yes stop_codon:yes gene_type:complete
MSRIAFLGTGNMGAGMAACLIKAGHDLTVYNRTTEKTGALTKQGATAADTPKEAAVGADAVIAMLSDDEASKAVWLGEDGALAAETAENAFAVECSTLSHDWVLELSATAGQKGFRYIDCPVTGIPVNAEAGELTLLVGADSGDLEAARPLLDPFSSEIIHFGPVGAGTAYKLMVNLMGAVQIAGAAEGMLIAEKAGLDPGQVADALAKGAAASPQVIRNTRRMAAADHGQNITFPGRLRLKDTLYGLRLADKLGQRTPFGDAARDAFQKLLDEGLEELNESKVIDVLRS